MSKRANEQTLLELQRENQVLASKILELESEAVETDVYRKEMRKRIAELEQSGKELQEEFHAYRCDVQQQESDLTAELVSREKQIHLLQAQKEAIERNCVQLTEALKAANEKNIELLKQVTNKNTFIRNCLQQDLERK